MSSRRPCPPPRATSLTLLHAGGRRERGAARAGGRARACGLRKRGAGQRTAESPAGPRLHRATAGAATPQSLAPPSPRGLRLAHAPWRLAAWGSAADGAHGCLGSREADCPVAYRARNARPLSQAQADRTRTAGVPAHPARARALPTRGAASWISVDDVLADGGERARGRSRPRRSPRRGRWAACSWCCCARTWPPAALRTASRCLSAGRTGAAPRSSRRPAPPGTGRCGRPRCPPGPPAAGPGRAAVCPTRAGQGMLSRRGALTTNTCPNSM